MPARLSKLFSARAPIARKALAAILTLAFFVSLAPFGSLSSNEMCAMECCTGLPAHLAGTCAGVACHADFESPQEKTQPPETESHCQQQSANVTAHHGGMHEPPPAEAVDSAQESEAGTAKDLSSTSAHSRPDSSTPVIAATVFKQPCRPECGTGCSGSFNQNHSRHTAALSQASRPRPPSVQRLSRLSSGPAKILSALCRRSRPRAPPSFS